MKHLIEVIISDEMSKKLGDEYVEKRIETEAKRMLGEHLFPETEFTKKRESFHQKYTGTIYTLTQEQVDYIDSILSLSPDQQKNIMDEILNK